LGVTRGEEAASRPRISRVAVVGGSGMKKGSESDSIRPQYKTGFNSKFVTTQKMPLCNGSMKSMESLGVEL